MRLEKVATPLTAVTDDVAAGSNPPGPFGVSVTVSDEDVTTLPRESSIFATVVGTTEPAFVVPGWVVNAT